MLTQNITMGTLVGAFILPKRDKWLFTTYFAGALWTEAVTQISHFLCQATPEPETTEEESCVDKRKKERVQSPFSDGSKFCISCNSMS